LLELNCDLSAIIPVHPNPNVRDILIGRLSGHPRVFLKEPLGYTEFIRVLSRALLVLTDSGGVQEECAALGKPVLVLRTHTERPEAVEAGVSIVVGTDSIRIIEQGTHLINTAKVMRRISGLSTIFGDGHASTRILDALLLAKKRDPAGK
jgi:UDP-N-acetylglucosamine 2-epimerase (non-hydrolysing)